MSSTPVRLEEPMPSNFPLPYDPSEGIPIPAVIASDSEAVASLPVKQLLELVPDPVASENRKLIELDPRLREYADLRVEVQRLVDGAKARNAKAYAKYILAGLKGETPYWVAPPITLYHREKLKEIEFVGGMRALLFPFGNYFVAIDGETQDIAWRYVAREYPVALDHRVKVVIHHGKPIEAAKQYFYDLNTREVKPNAAVAITMDTLDPATRITRSVMNASGVIRGRVHLRRRQLRNSDEDYLLTISALRTGVVTTILGAPGLQVGSRPITLADDVDQPLLENAVVDVWSSILETIEEALGSRTSTVVSAPSILAGIGVVAHHAIPCPPRKADIASWSIDEVLDRLDGVSWERQLAQSPNEGTGRHPWEGIAGKVTPTGNFSVGGPKEVGHAVAEALEDEGSAYYRQIRSQ